MKQALRIYRKKISLCDALVVLSCSTGVQTAMLCDPGIPVINVLDTFGGVVITHRVDHPLARSTCSMCGSCVLAYTGDICPLDSCPQNNLYQPCDRYTENGTRCYLEPGRECVWQRIEELGNPALLREVRRLHERGKKPDYVGSGGATIPSPVRKSVAWMAVRLSGMGLGRFIRLIK